MQSLKTKRNINNSNSTLSLRCAQSEQQKWYKKTKPSADAPFTKTKKTMMMNFVKKLIYHEAPFRRGEIIEIDAFKMEIRDELICYENYNGIIKIHHRISET